MDPTRGGRGLHPADLGDRGTGAGRRVPADRDPRGRRRADPGAAIVGGHGVRLTRAAAAGRGSSATSRLSRPARRSPPDELLLADAVRLEIRPHTEDDRLPQPAALGVAEVPDVDHDERGVEPVGADRSRVAALAGRTASAFAATDPSRASRSAWWTRWPAPSRPCPRTAGPGVGPSAAPATTARAGATPPGRGRRPRSASRRRRRTGRAGGPPSASRGSGSAGT